MISEEQLKLAAQRAGEALSASLPEPEDCEDEFSPAFQRKMKKLIRRTDHPGLYRGLKRAACFFLAILLSGGIWLSVDAEAREIVFGWISQRVENAQHYFFDGPNTDETPDVRYCLSEIPAGYSEWSSIEEENGWNTLYVNETGQVLEFGFIKQPTETTTADVFFITDDMAKELCSVDGNPAEIYLDNSQEKGNLIVWQKGKELLYISGYLSKEDLIQLAGSVIQEEK